MARWHVFLLRMISCCAGPSLSVLGRTARWRWSAAVLLFVWSVEASMACWLHILWRTFGIVCCWSWRGLEPDSTKSQRAATCSGWLCFLRSNSYYLLLNEGSGILHDEHGCYWCFCVELCFFPSSWGWSFLSLRAAVSLHLWFQVGGSSLLEGFSFLFASHDVVFWVMPTLSSGWAATTQAICFSE